MAQTRAASVPRTTPLAEPTQRLPAFAARLLAQSDGDRLASLESVHPEYAASKDQWQLLLDAFEGTGGFVDGSYIWPYPAERFEDYQKRQKMARYHNYVETIIDLYVRQVFTQEPVRQSDNEELNAWWDDVDGNGTGMSDFLQQAVSIALASGHTGILMDKTPDAPTGPAKADDKARPFLTRYVSTAITDWRTERDAVTGIKLLESVPPVGIEEEPPADATQVLIWDREGWARFNNDGTLIDADTPGLGLVPFEVLRPKRSVLRGFVGRSLFSHGKIIQALYNRMSEEDQVLRDQAFSLLTCEVEAGGDVEQAKKQLGSEFGTMRAAVVQGKIKYESPDMGVPAGIRDNIVQIIREIYRVAHMRYERDSLDAESAEAIRLQFKELNEMLQGLAAELQRVEIALARFFFAWTSPSPEQAQAAFEAANIVVEYPDEFFLADLRLDLDAWAQGIAMNLGPTMTKRIKKKAVRRIDPEIPIEEAQTVDAEIDGQPDEMSASADNMAAQLKSGAQSRLRQLLNTTSEGGA